MLNPRGPWSSVKCEVGTQPSVLILHPWALSCSGHRVHRCSGGDSHTGQGQPRAGPEGWRGSGKPAPVNKWTQRLRHSGPGHPPERPACCFSSSQPSPSNPTVLLLLWDPQQLFLHTRPSSAISSRPPSNSNQGLSLPPPVSVQSPAPSGSGTRNRHPGRSPAAPGPGPSTVAGQPRELLLSRSSCPTPARSHQCPGP